MIILTKSGFNALIRQIHRRLAKDGGTINGNLVINKDLEVKGHATIQLASYPDMEIGETVITQKRTRIL